MTKRKNSKPAALPSLEPRVAATAEKPPVKVEKQVEEKPVGAAAAVEEEEAAKRPDVAMETDSVLISVPLVHLEGGYRTRFVGANITRRESNVLRAIERGLEGGDLKLEDGRYCNGKSSAIRWILQQIAAGSEIKF